MRRLRGSLFWALLAVGSLFLAACGGGDGDDGGESVSAEAYAADICGALGAWIDSIVERSSNLQAGLSPGASAAEGQEALRGYLDEILGDTDQLADSIDEAGVPDVDGGDEFADALANGIDQAREALQTARENVDDLPTDDPEAFRDAADELGNEVNEALDAAGDPLQEFDIPELDQAVTEETACADIPTG